LAILSWCRRSQPNSHTRNHSFIHSIRLCTIQVLSLQRKETETKTERKIKEHRR
jgi:hypothetical protein